MVEMCQSIKHMFRDPDAVIRRARGVETILEYIWQREQAGKVIQNEDTGEVLNVQHFIAEPGFVGKISQLHTHFAKLETNDQKESMILAIATLSKRELLNRFVAKQEGDDIGIRLKATEKFDGNKNKHVVTMELDDSEWALFQKFVKKIVMFE